MDMSYNLKIVENYAVRIAIDDGSVLKGSGILYTSNQGKCAMIFTAAHVIHDEKGNVYKNLYLSFKDTNNHFQVINIKTKHVSNEELSSVESGNVYFHTSYNFSSLEYDAAIIFIPWFEWMNDLLAFRIGECKTGDSLLGIGFPESLNREWKANGVLEHGGKDNFCGIGIKHSEYSYSVSFEFSKASGIKIENAMTGFSGTGLFVQHKTSLEFSGVISAPRGTKSSKDTLWACSAKTFFDIMKQYSLNIVPPPSFEPYIEKITETFARCRQPAKDYFVGNAYKVIDQNVLPKHILNDSFADLQCDGERKLCNHYFLGQFKKCIILYLINGNEQVGQKRNMVKIPDPYNEVVFAEFLCSEAKAEDVIYDLVDKKYFAEQSTLNDGTIFLWNGGIHSHDKYEVFKRKEFRGILTDIADSMRKDNNMREVLKSLSLLLKTKEYKFSIIEGELQETDFALVSIEKFMNVIEHNGGDDCMTKLKIGELLKEIWEI